MYLIPKSKNQAEALLEHLKKIHGKSIDKKELQTLRDIFSSTPYPGLRDCIAETLVEAEDEAFYPYLINKIKEVIHTKYVSNLIIAAENYNCAEDIQVFIDLVILKADICLAFAMRVVWVMEDIEGQECKYAINKLKAYRESLDPSSSKYEDMTIIINRLANT